MRTKRDENRVHLGKTLHAEFLYCDVARPGGGAKSATNDDGGSCENGKSKDEN